MAGICTDRGLRMFVALLTSPLRCSLAAITAAFEQRSSSGRPYGAPELAGPMGQPVATCGRLATAPCDVLQVARRRRCRHSRRSVLRCCGAQPGRCAASQCNWRLSLKCCPVAGRAGVQFGSQTAHNMQFRGVPAGFPLLCASKHLGPNSPPSALSCGGCLQHSTARHSQATRSAQAARHFARPHVRGGRCGSVSAPLPRSRLRVVNRRPKTGVSFVFQVHSSP